VVEAALARLDELIENGEVDDRTGRTFHQLYEDLLDQIRTGMDEDPDEEVTDSLGLRRELVRTQREKLRRLYSKGKISAEALRAVDRWLDLEDPDIREVG
jgi:CPA1 family monovalent cation:H+ antiporter